MNETQTVKVLSGHVSPESAFLVEDYPYGFRLRCKIRYWLEHHPKRGTRFVSQTSNPKRGNVWNKPKASTYCRFGGALYTDEKGHVQWSGVSEYDDLKRLTEWRAFYGASLPPEPALILDNWISLKTKYEEAKAQGLIQQVTTITRPDGTTETTVETLT